jgi:hypothetical protein
MHARFRLGPHCMAGQASLRQVVRQFPARQQPVPGFVMPAVESRAFGLQQRVVIGGGCVQGAVFIRHHAGQGQHADILQQRRGEQVVDILEPAARAQCPGRQRRQQRAAPELRHVQRRAGLAAKGMGQRERQRDHDRSPHAHQSHCLPHIGRHAPALVEGRVRHLEQLGCQRRIARHRVA